MITPITATFPALNFPKEVDYPTQEDWAAFSAAAELNYGILSGEWSDKSEEFKEQTNNLALEIHAIGENAFNAISLNTIEDLATYSGTGLVMVKDINRGGTFVSKLSTDIDPNTGSLYSENDGTVFIKLGGGFWVRQYNGSINVKWFGAIGDWNGVTGTDNTIAFNSAMAVGNTFIPPEKFLINGSIYLTNKCKQLFGEEGSVLIQGTTNAHIYVPNLQEVTIKQFKLDGALTNGGIIINGSSSGILIDNIYFYKGNQRVWLFTCHNIEVSSCTFENTGYGIVQQIGNVSNNVIISNCLAFDMVSDFVEANCASAAPSKNWIITGNQYLGNISYPSSSQERRFVGITSVENVTISNNIVEKSSGDSAIHLEDTKGDTIINSNIFDNIICSNGNDGYIYVLNSAENTIVSNNIFKRTDSTLSHAYSYSCASSYYSNEVLFSNNKVIGNGVTKNISGLNISFNGGKGMLISNNYFYELLYSVSFVTINNVSFISNVSYNCDNGFVLLQTPTSAGGTNVTITSNVFIGTVVSDIYTSVNTNGTSSPKKWKISENKIAKQIRFEDYSGGGALNASGIICNNVFETGVKNVISGAGTRTQVINNYYLSDTIYTPRSSLPNYANDSAAAAAGIEVGGMYRNGNIVQIRVV